MTTIRLFLIIAGLFQSLPALAFSLDEHPIKIKTEIPLKFGDSKIWLKPGVKVEINDDLNSFSRYETLPVGIDLNLMKYVKRE